MNIANSLTLIRIFLVPFFMFFLNYNNLNFYFNHISLLLFIIASITDFFDGYIARKKNLITNLGKFLDPLADKILIVAALLCFLNLKLIDVWVVFIILTREFLVVLVRLLAVKKGIVIAANFWGKLKTVLQILACITTILFLIQKNEILNFCYIFLIYSSTVCSVVSGFLYLLKNKHVLKDN